MTDLLSGVDPASRVGSLSDDLSSGIVNLSLGLLVLLDLTVGDDFVGVDALALLTQADVAAANCNTSDIDGVLNIKRALGLVATAVALSHSVGLLVALSAHVRITAAVVSGQVAAKVALVLEELEAVLDAPVLIVLVLLEQGAPAAHELSVSEIGALWGIEAALHGAVDVATVESGLTSRALVELSAEEGVFNFALEVFVIRVVDALLVAHAVVLHLLYSYLTESALQDLKLHLLLAHLADVADTINILGAAGALEAVEVDSLGSPSVSHEIADALTVEEVLALELDHRASAKVLGADHADVGLIGQVIGAALSVEARRAMKFTLDASTGVATLMLLGAGLNWKHSLELWDCVSGGTEAEPSHLLLELVAIIGDDVVVLKAD